MEESDRLAHTYRLCKTLTIHGYLKRVYPGRQILTRLRTWTSGLLATEA